MPLAAGTRLGPYEVLELIGAGCLTARSPEPAAESTRMAQTKLEQLLPRLGTDDPVRYQVVGALEPANCRLGHWTKDTVDLVARHPQAPLEFLDQELRIVGGTAAQGRAIIGVDGWNQRRGRRSAQVSGNLASEAAHVQRVGVDLSPLRQSEFLVAAAHARVPTDMLQYCGGSAVVGIQLHGRPGIR